MPKFMFKIYNIKILISDLCLAPSYWFVQKFSFIVHTKWCGGIANSQSAFTCSKLTTETLEQGTDGVVLVSLLLILNIFHTLF